jgi:hypothetical protein
VIGRQTIKKRMRATLHAINSELRKRWHDPVPKTGEWIQKSSARTFELFFRFRQ